MDKQIPTTNNGHESTHPTVIWIVPLLVSTILPGLRWVMGAGAVAVRIELGVAMSVAVATIAIGVLAILSKGFRHRIRWALGVTAVAVLTLFQWPLLTSAGIEVAATLRIPILSDVVPVLLAVAFIWLAIRLASETIFAVLLGSGLLAIAITVIVAGFPGLSGPPEQRAVTDAAPGSPDVILLVLDGYASEDVLQQAFGFDNSEFYSQLANLGFEIAAEARANYSFTYAAVSTMLNLDYTFDVGEISDLEREAMRKALSGDPALYELFHKAGYDIAYAENPWDGSYCGRAADICWRDGLTERVLWNLGQLTILAPLVSSLRPHPFNTVSFDNLRRLPEIVERDRTEGVPRLTVAHVILPHPPLLLDSSCNRQQESDRRPLRVTDPESIKRRRSYFVDQLICTNDTTLQGLQTIINTRSDTVVMMTADHGSELTRAESAPVTEWTDTELASRMEILSAYRLPGCNGSVYPAITPVNGIRLTANCALGTALDYLPDHSLWAPSAPDGQVTDVGARLDD